MKKTRTAIDEELPRLRKSLADIEADIALLKKQKRRRKRTESAELGGRLPFLLAMTKRQQLDGQIKELEVRAEQVKEIIRRKEAEDDSQVQGAGAGSEHAR